MAKRQQPLLERRHVIEKLGLSQVLDGFRQLAWTETGNDIQDRDRYLATDHGGHLEHLLRAVVKTIDPGRDDRLHRWRQGNGIDASPQPVGALLSVEITALDQGVDKLFQEKGIALRALDDVAAQQRERGV